MDQTSETPKPLPKKPGKSDRWVKLGLGLIVLAIVVVVVWIQFGGPGLGPEWNLHDVNTALVQAKAEDRRVVVFVRAWPINDDSKFMIQTTLKKDENRQALKKGNFILVDAAKDAQADWARKYGVTKAPTTLIISPDGSRFVKREGRIGEVEFRREFLNEPLRPVGQD